MNILTRVTELQTHLCFCFGFISIFYSCMSQKQQQQQHLWWAQNV